jgi:hypothetical protein
VARDDVVEPGEVRKLATDVDRDGRPESRAEQVSWEGKSTAFGMTPVRVEDRMISEFLPVPRNDVMSPGPSPRHDRILRAVVARRFEAT